MSAEKLEKLRALNPALNIAPAESPAFAPYGRLVQCAGIDGLLRYLRENTPVGEGSAYVPSDEGAERLAVYDSLRREAFGGQDIQLGWCNGTNTVLNALEYHAGAEVNVAAADVVLLVAKQSDRDGAGRVDAGAVRGFYLEAGGAALLESGTLHFAPCATGAAGFRVGIALPRGTNTPLAGGPAKEGALWRQNKWLLAHAGAAHLVEAGAFVGLTGPRVCLRWQA